MSFLELFIIAGGLSMDAFAAALCKGLPVKKSTLGEAAIVGLYFGIFQAGMPLLGFLLGVRFQNKIASFDHWIAFLLLGIIGINMIRESKKVENIIISERNIKESLSFKNMIGLAVATSIDALAIGVTFAFLKVNIIIAITLIGIVTFTLSFAGVKIGNVFGEKYKGKAEFAGGMILIIMGLKILLNHTGII
ncbi:MAG: manganese efflux pump MntP family protein [Solirubrobacterales bacterium]